MKTRSVPQAKTNRDVRAIRRLAAAWRRGWLEGDADALVSLYAENPVLMPQGHPAIVGKKAIRAVYRAVLRELVITSTGKLREVRACGDLGYMWSTYRLVATPKQGGTSTRSSGKSIFILEREANGQWKIARLIDNADAAEPDKMQRSE